MFPKIPVATAAFGAEPAAHRNQRAKRQRARRVVRLWKLGCTVAPSQLAAANKALVDHHGTRGGDPMAPGGKKNNTVCIETGDGFTSTVRVIRPNEWWCPNKKCQDACTHPFGHWVWPKNKECNRCHTDRPTGKACKLFAGSKWANVQDKARGGPGGGGAKSGGPNRQNEKASEKEIRDLKEEAVEAKRQEEIRRLKADRQQQQADNDENDETSDKSGSESNESMLRLEEQFALSDLQDAQKRYEA